MRAEADTNACAVSADLGLGPRLTTVALTNCDAGQPAWGVGASPPLATAVARVGLLEALAAAGQGGSHTPHRVNTMMKLFH